MNVAWDLRSSDWVDYPSKKLCLPSENALEMDHIANCVIHDRVPHTPGEEGLQDQRLMALIYQAAQTGETIKLPPVRGLDTTRGTAPRMLK